MKDKLKVIAGLIIVVVILILIGEIVYKAVRAKNESIQNPVATFEVKDYGSVKIELYPEYAPNTVSNFIALIEAGYYNNKVIYGKDDICLYMARASETEEESAEEIEEESTEEATDETIENDENTPEISKTPKLSMIDSSVEADSDEDYEYEINGEFIANGFEQNTLRHEKGVISLNRSDYTSYGLTEESYNSGSAQFSVMMQDSPNLNGVYCAFGKVTEGLDILEKIYNELPIKENEAEDDGHNHEEEESSMKEFSAMPIIENATVEKNGIDYEKPEVHEAFDIQSYINELYSRYYSN